MLATKPLLRWAGSKRKLLPVLRQYWNSDYSRYIEPFAGSACLYFSLAPKQAILADLNAELIEMYHVVRERPEVISDCLEIYSGEKEEYYRVRAQEPGELDSATRAARFIYLNRYCFNGLYRTNRNGQFNVPFGGGKTGRLPLRDELLGISKMLQNTQLVSADFETVVKTHVETGDFVYLDPPYFVKGQRVFREYSGAPFSEIDLERLSELLMFIDKKGGKFVMSYHDCEDARNTIRGWAMSTHVIQRQIAGFVGARKMQTELIATNIR